MQKLFLRNIFINQLILCGREHRNPNSYAEINSRYRKVVKTIVINAH